MLGTKALIHILPYAGGMVNLKLALFTGKSRGVNERRQSLRH